MAEENSWWKCGNANSDGKKKGDGGGGKLHLGLMQLRLFWLTFKVKKGQI